MAHKYSLRLTAELWDLSSGRSVAATAFPSYEPAHKNIAYFDVAMQMHVCCKMVTSIVDISKTIPVNVDGHSGEAGSEVPPATNQQQLKCGCPLLAPVVVADATATGC